MGSARMIRRYYIKISLFESENDCDTNYAKKKKKKKKKKNLYSPRFKFVPIVLHASIFC